MKTELLFTICIITIVGVCCQELDDTVEDQILKSVIEGKKCMRTTGEIIFILDSSTSVGPDNFKKEKDFVTKILDKIVIGKNMSRVALITYNNFPSLVFNLDKYYNSNDIKKQIMEAEFSEGITVVGDALHMVLSDIDSKTRPSVGKVIILISDGKQNGGADPIVAARQLKSKNYLILTIGLDKDSDEKALIAMSSKRDFYLIKDFDSLPQIVTTIAMKTCTQFHISKCPKSSQEKGPCINKLQTNTIKFHYYVDGKCITEERSVTIKCGGVKECPNSYFQQTGCGLSNASFILFHNYTRRNGLCSLTTVNVKKVLCGCPNSKETRLKVIIGKECKDGLRKKMLIYHEFNKNNCSERYLNFQSVSCASPCKGISSVVGVCVNGKRTITIYKKVPTNNNCTLQFLNTTASLCEQSCPKSLIIKSQLCLNNMRNVYLISFKNINNKCVKETKKLQPETCTNSTKCPPSRYRVEKCEKKSGVTFLIRTFYQQLNGTCSKKEQRIKQLSCACQSSADKKISVIYGKACINGHLTRRLAISENRNGKCVNVFVTLSKIRCNKPCQRRSKITVKRCQAGKRTVEIMKAVRQGSECLWKKALTKVIQCKNACPKSKVRKSRCIQGKLSIFQMNFREVGDLCQLKVNRLKVESCQECQKSSYRVAICPKNAKYTFLIRTFYEDVKGKCIKKEKKVKQLSCKCNTQITKEIKVTVGKQCRNGYVSRILELSEERNNKCVKVQVKLRRIRCQRPCSKLLRTSIGKCISNQREIIRMKAVRENETCVWKKISRKAVKCKNVCPMTKVKTTRCIRGRQVVMKISFQASGQECKFSIVRLNITGCQRCPRSTYRVDKCEKKSGVTFLIRTFYQHLNGTCSKKEQRIKQLSCACQSSADKNISVIYGKACINRHLTRRLAVSEHRNGKCVNVFVTLSRIRCNKPCQRRSKIIIKRCQAGKRTVEIMKALRQGSECLWKKALTKVIQCKNVCPKSKVRKSRCIQGRQNILQMNFRQVGDLCQLKVKRLKVVPCQECQKSSYRVAICPKNAKSTYLIRTFYQDVKGKCIKKEKKVKQLSCKCNTQITKEIKVTVGKQCRNGYVSRILELSEERNNKCVKVQVKLRRIRCQRPCSKLLRTSIGKCISNQREIIRMKAVRENETCVWKKISRKAVKCKNVCPMTKVKTTRCIRGRQAVMKISFQESGQECKFTIVRLNITGCQISGKFCKPSIFNLSPCTNGTASVTETRFTKIGNKCKDQSEKVAEISCSKKCERNLRPKLVASKCINNKKLIFFISSTVRATKCFHKVKKLGEITCKKC